MKLVCCVFLRSATEILFITGWSIGRVVVNWDATGPGMGAGSLDRVERLCSNESAVEMKGHKIADVEPAVSGSAP